MEKPIIINRVFETTDTMLYSRSEWWFSRYIHPYIHTYIPGTYIPYIHTFYTWYSSTRYQVHRTKQSGWVLWCLFWAYFYLGPQSVPFWEGNTWDF